MAFEGGLRAGIGFEGSLGTGIGFEGGLGAGIGFVGVFEKARVEDYPEGKRSTQHFSA